MSDSLYPIAAFIDWHDDEDENPCRGCRDKRTSLCLEAECDRLPVAEAAEDMPRSHRHDADGYPEDPMGDEGYDPAEDAARAEYLEAAHYNR